MKVKFNLQRISFELIAFIVLVVLKLKGVIDWPWWQVTAILWMEVVIIIGGLLSLLFILWMANKMNQ